MDWEAVKLIGIAVSLVNGILTVGEKLCKWGKSAYLYIKKSKKVVALQDGNTLFLFGNIEQIKKLQKDGLSEDAAKDAEAGIQDLTNRYTLLIEKHLQAKDKEIMAV